MGEISICRIGPIPGDACKRLICCAEIGNGCGRKIGEIGEIGWRNCASGDGEGD